MAIAILFRRCMGCARACVCDICVLSLNALSDYVGLMWELTQRTAPYLSTERVTSPDSEVLDLTKFSADLQQLLISSFKFRSAFSHGRLTQPPSRCWALVEYLQKFKTTVNTTKWLTHTVSNGKFNIIRLWGLGLGLSPPDSTPSGKGDPSLPPIPQSLWPLAILDYVHLMFTPHFGPGVAPGMSTRRWSIDRNIVFIYPGIETHLFLHPALLSFLIHHSAHLSLPLSFTPGLKPTCLTNYTPSVVSLLPPGLSSLTIARTVSSELLGFCF